MCLNGDWDNDKVSGDLINPQALDVGSLSIMFYRLPHSVGGCKGILDL